MKAVALALTTLTLFCNSASGQAYYIATTGSDLNDCSLAAPCATMQHVYSVCPNGGVCSLTLAPGTYSQRLDATYYKVFEINGQMGADGSCADRAAVEIDDRVDGVPTAGALFSGQDHVILTVQCVTVRAYATGSIGFASRQFAILDINYVAFLDLPGGFGISVDEMSRANTVSPHINGSASRWAVAGDGSTLTVGGNLVYSSGTMEVAIIGALYGAIVNFYPSSVRGKPAGYAYQCVDATLRNATAIPGRMGAYPGTDNCHL